jgi:hypothetical protein
MAGKLQGIGGKSQEKWRENSKGKWRENYRNKGNKNGLKSPNKKWWETVGN